MGCNRNKLLHEEGGLFPETEHAFRVRAVVGNSVGEWSNVAEEKMTQKETFESSGWKERPVYVGKWRKYSVDEENPRIATNIGDNDFCTIIGNASFAHNKVTSWSIKILKSKRDDGSEIWIGVAPSGINQNESNENKCGWYFACYSSTLISGPPHNYVVKEYGPRKEWGGKYVHTGDSVGVVMDTAKGEL